MNDTTDLEEDTHDESWYDDRCVACGADVDHYLGCPDDPNPDYEAEAEAGYVGLAAAVRALADKWDAEAATSRAEFAERVHPALAQGHMEANALQARAAELRALIAVPAAAAGPGTTGGSDD